MTQLTIYDQHPRAVTVGGCGAESVEGNWVCRQFELINKPVKPDYKTQGVKEMDNYYIIRSDRAGVFFARIKERNGSEAVLTDCRRLWYWSGAASISQLSVDGVKTPSECKFTVSVPEMTVLGVIEIIPCSTKSVASIKGVKAWTA